LLRGEFPAPVLIALFDSIDSDRTYQRAVAVEELDVHLHCCLEVDRGLRIEDRGFAINGA
jgi:hypothetical protein